MRRHRKLHKLLTCFVLCILAIALITVSHVKAENTQNNNRFNVVVVLDASGSMKKTDPQDYRFEAIKQFANLLAEQGNMLGGVVFHTDVAAEQKLTSVLSQGDKDAVVDLLESVPDNGSWTNIGAGLSRAVSMIKTNGNPDLPSVIVFLSDGNTDMENEEALQASLDLKADAIQEAREQGIAIYSICLNANNRADTTEMQQISDATNGIFREVTRAEDLQEVFNAFYNLIYGTTTITLLDSQYPSSGRLETTFEVPGVGVEEVNIILYGSTVKKSLIKPDGTDSDVIATESDTFSMLKITDVIPGQWRLITEGNPGDTIKINMVYNTNLAIEVSLDPAEGIIHPEDAATFCARLKSGNSVATLREQYTGYSADLILLDSYGEFLEKIPMKLGDSGFELVHRLEQGNYYYKVIVSGNYIERESDIYGPLISTTDVLSERERKNTPPQPVEEVVEAKVAIWPFKGGSYTLDLNTLATDAQDDVLKYKIKSSSFIEGTDYTVDDNGVLHMDHFSLSKGAFTISAYDSMGLSCDIEVIVKTYNIGVMTMIGLGILALIGLAILGLLLYLALTPPFRGTIRAQSYCNGVYRGVERNPRKGRCKLSVFEMDNIGLDYQKSYFQATGKNYVELHTNRPVIWNGQETKTVRIPNGVEVVIAVQRDDPRRIYIRFTSRMKNMPRSGAGRPNGPTRPTRPTRPSGPTSPTRPIR